MITFPILVKPIYSIVSGGGGAEKKMVHRPRRGRGRRGKWDVCAGSGSRVFPGVARRGGKGNLCCPGGMGVQIGPSNECGGARHWRRRGLHPKSGGCRHVKRLPAFGRNCLRKKRL